jgi:hypothetical protein
MTHLLQSVHINSGLAFAFFITTDFRTIEVDYRDLSFAQASAWRLDQKIAWSQVTMNNAMTMNLV